MGEWLFELAFLLVGGAALSTWWHYRVERGVDDAEFERGCLVCSSRRLVEKDGLLRCLDCGYEGRADRGGRLEPEDIAALQMGGDEEMDAVPPSVSAWRD